ncbi:carbamoyl phosphate synthase [Heyndrickxia sporothermodurans]|nr:carbamoyl phosphate synthase [Heyndrickxia sporothermodurans]
MNLLICSAGRRVKLVKYFREELSKLGGNIIAIDCDLTAPALQYANISEVVPRITDINYVNVIKQLCSKYNIDAILSLIDPELNILAEHKNDFEKANIKIIVSNKEVVDICFDKYLTYQFLKINDLPRVPTYISKDEALHDIRKNLLQLPLIVKPRRGSASLGVSIINSIEELNVAWNNTKDLVIQPFITGHEYGVDCYVDLIKVKATHIFGKRKVKMRAGETDKSIAVKDEKLFYLIEQLVDALKPIGPIDIDCFKTETNYIISEINPRFGGGYPHAHELGQNFVKNIINNLCGESVKEKIGSYPDGSIMVKYDDVLILNG